MINFFLFEQFNVNFFWFYIDINIGHFAKVLAQPNGPNIMFLFIFHGDRDLHELALN